jgi:hypothetical protein
MIVSIFKSVDKVDVPFHRDVQYIFERIKKSPKKDLIQQIRKEKDKQKRNDLKKQLPGYCFGGQFQRRSKDGLMKSSGLAIFDIDCIPTKAELNKLKEQIASDPFAFAVFISPSGNGLKLLVKVPEEADQYKGYYNTYLNYLVQTYDVEQYLDKATSDISRFCFESHDPKLIVNEQSEQWNVIDAPDLDDFGSTEVNIPITSEHIIVERLLKWFDSKYSMSEGSRNENLFKLAAAFNDFGVQKSTSLNVASRFIQNGFGASEIEKIIDSAYRRGISSFGTKFFEDDSIKGQIEKMIRDGKSVDRIREIFPEKSKKEVAIIVEKAKEDIEADVFWTYDKNGKPILIPHKYKYWLQSNGFFKHYPDGSDVFTFIRKQNNIIEETNEKKIKDFVLDWLLYDSDDGYLVYDYMAKSAKYFTLEFLSFLDNEDVKIKKDDKNHCYLYYNNGAVEITKNGINVIDYVDVDGFIWKKQLIGRDYVKKKSQGEFERFVELIAGDEKRFNSLRSIIGFMCHGYTTSANNRAIVLNDEMISENPNGGSGKSLFANSFSHIKKMVTIDGKHFQFDKSFAYQLVSIDTQVLLFDDVKKNFNFENLFSVITGGITIEYKNQQAVKLPISESPKVMITTNYTLGGVGGSHERRKFEVELSDHFSQFHSPLDEFGRMMFDDWSSDDWIAFDNFMIDCIRYYLEKGLVKSDFKNLEVRKFIRETSSEFYEWTEGDDGIRYNKRMNKKELFESFIEEYNDLKRWLTQKRFSMWLDQLAVYKGIKILKGKTNGQRWVELVDESLPDDEDDIVPF